MDVFDGLQEAMDHLSGRGAFLTVKDAENRVNTMTIGWGYIGYSWNKPFFAALVRDSRYTHELLKSADSFTVSIPFDASMHKALAFCGSHSGRDVNKEEAAGISFVSAKAVASPVVDGCSRYYECAISYIDTIQIDKLPPDFREKFYGDGDFHDIYYGEIVRTYTGR